MESAKRTQPSAEIVCVRIAIMPSSSKVKVGDCSRGRPEGSPFQ